MDVISRRPLEAWRQGTLATIADLPRGPAADQTFELEACRLRTVSVDERRP